MLTVAYTKLLEDEAGIEGRIRKMHTVEIGVPQTNFQEFGLVKRKLETSLAKYSAAVEWYPGEELANAYNAVRHTYGVDMIHG